MQNRYLSFLLFVCGITYAWAEEIRPVTSWNDYREYLKSRGKSASEIDSDIATGFARLKAMDRSAGKDRIGLPAPPLDFQEWVNTKPLSLQDLRGHVVLIRWWTDTCPFCASSAPALRKLDEQYAARGLKVIGVFHPKAGRNDPMDMTRVRHAVEARQFTFPVAVDWEWQTHALKSWWYTGPTRPASSVTFLVDKQGIIRYVHPGMEYHDGPGSEEHAMCVNDMAGIRAAIEKLIAE